MNLIRKYLIVRRWNKSKKRKRTIRMKVRDCVSLFRKLEENGFRYVVLRWPEEVPITLAEENNFHEDIDLLIDINKPDLPRLAGIVSDYHGHIACDLYSPSGRAGTSYLGMPYYPPALTELILNDRYFHSNGFYIPNPENSFLSFAFHLVYHKGALSGIPTGCDIETEPSPKRLYSKRLHDLARQAGISEIEPPYTLLQIHNYLKIKKWDMPYDLLERWPKKDKWHHYLLKQEIEALEPWAKKLPGLLVFFIREDVMKDEYMNFIMNSLSEKFSILHREKLSHLQIESVMRSVRGGNWSEGKNLEKVRPKMAIIAYDHNPIPVELSGYEKKGNYPLVKNLNVFIKQEIRQDLNDQSADNKKLFGIHGSDNEYEAQHMIRSVYGNKSDDINMALLEQIKKAKLPV